MDRSTWNSEKSYLHTQTKMGIGFPSEPKTDGILDKPRVKIVDPGASWRKFFCAVFAIRASLAIFLVAAQGRRVYGYARGLSQTLTKFPAFLLF
jgi:hypothetical protein